MLDYITIRLDYYRDLFQLLSSVYMRVNVVNDRGSLCVMATSKFIIRTCIGWLFEHPEIPEEYYSLNNSKAIANEVDVVDSEIVAQLNPHLETILNAACPFLADFRVSVMPQRTTKAVSRTGRYRHITTQFQDKSGMQKTNVQDNRERLIEAFLASQMLSVRKIVDFTIDRVSSAVVKDFQVRHLLTIRKQAKAEVEQAVATIQDVDTLLKKMIAIYQQHLKRLQDQWDEDVKKNCNARVLGAFDSLLPIETLGDVKKTLINITVDKTNDKLQDWSSNNIATIEIFSKDIQADAAKMKESLHQNGNKGSTSSIIIYLATDTMPSDYFRILQTLLHTGSRHPERITDLALVECVEMAMEVLNKQTLPSNAYRNIAFYELQLVFLLIVHRADLLTANFFTKLFELWHHEKLQPFTSKNSSSESSPNRIKVDDFVFSEVISSRLMLAMQGMNRRSFEVYGDFLVALVKENFITSEHINEQSVRLYQIEWSKESLNDIAFLLQRVKGSLPSATPSESQLFMELVGDLARDMENF